MTDQVTTLPGEPPSTTVLICDERPATRRELTTLLTSGDALRVLAAVDGAGLVDAFAAAPAGVVLIGVHCRSDTGIAAMTRLHGLHPTARVIAYGGRQDAPLLTTAVARGASGLLIWAAGQSHQITSPGEWHRDRTGPGPAPKPAVSFTDREIQILRGMSRGQSNGSIGLELYLSEDTVKTHARRLFNKIGAQDRAHAVALGLRAGLL